MTSFSTADAKIYLVTLSSITGASEGLTSIALAFAFDDEVRQFPWHALGNGRSAHGVADKS